MPKTPEEIAAEEKALADKAAADKIAADKAAADKLDADKKADADKTVVIKVEIPKVDTTKQYDGATVEKMIQDAIKASSVTTKNQLHDEIEKMKVKLAEAETALKSNPDSEALKENNILINAKLKILEEEVAKSIKKNETLEQSISAEKLETERLKLIADAKGAIIPELVTGNTIEELRASAVKAADKHKEIQAQIRQSLNLPAEPEKSGEEKKNEKLDIARINPQDPKALKSWEQERKAIVEKIYEEYKIKS